MTVTDAWTTAPLAAPAVPTPVPHPVPPAAPVTVTSTVVTPAGTVNVPSEENDCVDVVPVDAVACSAPGTSSNNAAHRPARSTCTGALNITPSYQATAANPGSTSLVASRLPAVRVDKGSVPSDRRMSRRRLNILGVALIGACLLGACGRPTARPIEPTQSPKSAFTVAHKGVLAVLGDGAARGPDLPCVKSAAAPPASRLTAPRDYSQLGVHLSVVPPSTMPGVSAHSAFIHLPYGYQADPQSCGIAEILAYWTSANPATIPASCVPPDSGTTPATPPADCPTTPLFAHVLAWVFTWRTDCSPTGPNVPAGMPAHVVPSWSPFACTAITFVDATTGHPSGYLDTGDV